MRVLLGARRFHPGERAVQMRANALSKADAVGRIIDAAVPHVAVDFLANQRFIVIGGTASDAHSGTERVWASQLSGPKGFVTVPTAQTLSIAAQTQPADPLARAFDVESPIGILAIEPSSRRRLRANGVARNDGERFHVTLDQVFSNCPKYISTRELEADERTRASEPRAGDALTGEQRSWIGGSDTFFIATYAREYGADASHRGGHPGFVRVVGSRHLVWPDYTGNAMYMTLGNLELDARAGLLFIDWESGSTLQLSGTARVVWTQALTERFEGAQRLVVFTIERVLESIGAMPLRWQLRAASPSSPTENAAASALDAAAEAAVREIQ